jgi:hypothetical protein
MRHFLLSRPIAAHPGSVPPSATLACLIAPTGRLQGPSPRPRGAAFVDAVAVDLSSVAAAANDHLAAATGAQEQAARYSHGLPGVADAA